MKLRNLIILIAVLFCTTPRAAFAVSHTQTTTAARGTETDPDLKKKKEKEVWQYLGISVLALLLGFVMPTVSLALLCFILAFSAAIIGLIVCIKYLI